MKIGVEIILERCVFTNFGTWCIQKGVIVTPVDPLLSTRKQMRIIILLYYIDPWLTCDHFVGKASAMGQPTRPTQPSIPSGSVNE